VTLVTALNSISNNTRVLIAAMIIMLRDRWFIMMSGGFIVLWTVRPVFELAIAALIHASGRTELVSYAVIGITANAFIFSAIFWVGELLDRERMRGTLPVLLLSPSSRVSWLGGFTLAGAAETMLMATVVLSSGILLFGVMLDVAWLSLIVVSALFLMSLVGLGLILGAFGLLVKQSNGLSNMIMPAVLLLGGIYFPVSELPDALRILARMLPMGYAIEALALSTLQAAPLSELTHLIIPLMIFALVLPITGYLAISWIDHLVRKQGTMDLY
jgi:ABC-2 type transport system permease protein